MFHTSRRSIAIALAGLSLLSLVSPSCHADEYFTRAVSFFRDNSYEESFSQAMRSSDSPQRTFLMGIASLRRDRAAESLPLLAEAEQKLPLAGDYAALFQAEAFMKLKRYGEAAAKAAALPASYPSSLLIRRAAKLRIDALVAAGEYPTAIRLCREFIEKYPAGADSVDVLYLSGKSHEENGDRSGAALIYRSVWLNSPLAPQAADSRERLKAMEKSGVAAVPFTVEELFRRASNLSARNRFSQSLQTLQSIPLTGQPAAVVDRVLLREGLNQYRLKKWKDAEKSLLKSSGSAIPAIRSEARFWHAKTLARLDLDDRTFSLFMAMAAEGKKQEFADDALMEAAGMRKGAGCYSEAARLFERVGREFPESRSSTKAVWEAGWCHYLAGEYPAAASSFRQLLRDEGMREKALYWLGRSLENSGSIESVGYFTSLLDEYPAGFYAVWRREQMGIRDPREGVSRQASIDVTIPAGYEKPRLLASLGLINEARAEIAAIRRKSGNRKGELPGVARIYLEAGDYSSSVALFRQNPPSRWEKDGLNFWSAGYPLAYTDQIAQHTAVNSLPESLVYALIRTESSFSPAVKSPAGAIGLMQLMPATARATAREKGAFNAARLISPDYNIMLGTRHFRDLLKRFNGDVVYSVAAYNAGTSAVHRWQKRLKGLRKDEFIEAIPYQETRDYVKSVYASAATYRQLYGLR